MMRSDTNKLNRALALTLSLGVIISTVFIGLNRPLLWAGFSTMIGLVAMIYFANLWRVAPNRTLAARKLWPAFACAALVPIWAIVQSIALPQGQGWGSLLSPDLQPSTLSLMPDAGRSASVRFAFYGLWMALVLEAARRVSRGRLMLQILFWGVSAHALWGLLALNVLGDITVWGEAKTTYQGFATGVFINRNSFASFLAMGAVIGVTLLIVPAANQSSHRSTLLSHGNVTNGLYALGLVIIFAALFATGSRLGVACALLACLLCIGVCLAQRGLSAWRIVLGSLGLIALGGGAMALLYGKEGILRLFDLSIAGDVRMAAWGRIWDLILLRPLTGYGFETFRPAYELIHGGTGAGEQIWDRAHATYLSLWLELGLIIGTVPIVLFFWAAMVLVRRVHARGRDAPLAIAALFAMLAVGLHSLGDFGLEMPANVFLLLTLVGIGLAPRA